MTQHVLALPDGDVIPYLLERRARRTIGMLISPHGLVVHAPQRLAQAALEQLLLSKSGWILSRLQAQAENQVAAIGWQDGSELLWLGNRITLSVRADRRNRAVQLNPGGHPQGTLLVALTSPEDETAVARKVVQWYRKQALQDFDRRLALFAARLQVAKPSLLLSNARTRWGSCNSRKEIRINWRLIQAPPSIINYVICHELAHLKQMNHSAKFWAVVASLYPDYAQAEQALKGWAAQLYAIG